MEQFKYLDAKTMELAGKVNTIVCQTKYLAYREIIICFVLFVLKPSPLL